MSTTVHEVLARFSAGHPQCVVADALYCLNEAIREVLHSWPWAQLRTSYEKVCVRSHSNGTVTESSAHVYALVTGLFSPDDVGGTLSIVASESHTGTVSATITEYVSENEVVIDTPWAYATQVGGVELTVTAYRFALPSDFRRLEDVRVAGVSRPLVDPSEYEYRHVDGEETLTMTRVVPSPGAAVTVTYQRNAVLVSGPGSAIDAADDLLEAVYQTWRMKLLGRWIPGSDFEVEARRTWLSEAKAARDTALNNAKQRDSLASLTEQRNARHGGLSFGKVGYVRERW